MPDTPFWEEDTFEPDVLEAMRAAYRMARQSPQLEYTADSIAEVLAERIVDLAGAGETNPALLCCGALLGLLN
jgi:hypothetical protein